MKFSQRIGITPIERPIQLHNIDDNLRQSLWNVYFMYIIESIKNYNGRNSDDKIKDFFIWLWYNYLNWNIETVEIYFSRNLNKIREFFFECDWYVVYELIEASIEADNHTTKNINKDKFVNQVNIILEREFSAYRFINNVFAPISNEYEINEIENALQYTNNFTALIGCNKHLSESLRILSDKKTQDYRNSIKESISAIESIVKTILNKNGGTLGDLLKYLENKITINKILSEGVNKIYGYTSSASTGIRHGMMEDATCDFEDAKYMLVSSSAFINYLIAKANKAGITFQ